MPVVPATSTLVKEQSVVTLARYIQLINYPAPCAFWGVYNSADAQLGCRTIWQKVDRDMVQRALDEAQEEIEQEVGYPLAPTWITGEVLPYGPQAPAARIYRWEYRPPVLSRKTMVIAGGVRGETTIQAGAAVDHSADPAVIGPIATALTDEDEIHIFHPGTDVEIDPSDITIAGGNLTITVPRCRMVKAALADNDKNGVPYDDTSNFEATVDVKRIYNDVSTNATLVWPHACSSTCSTNGCSEYTRTACIYVHNGRLGHLDVQPATYTDGSWIKSTAGCCRGKPEIVRLNYYAGLTPLTQQVELAIVRLAHSKLPETPCGCSIQQAAWKRDLVVPATLTRERVNNPFGLSNGAWFAWQQSQTLKIRRGGLVA